MDVNAWFYRRENVENSVLLAQPPRMTARTTWRTDTRNTGPSNAIEWLALI
jgi:hypothetical protein